MSETKIYSFYHKDFFKPKLELVQPLQVGRALSDLGLGILTDDGGENISAKNKEYCELTGIYYVLNNVSNVDIVGFCHYRRLFVFRKMLLHRNFRIGRITDEIFNYYNQNPTDKIKRYLSSYDIIVPCKRVTRFNVKDYYIYNHIKEDWLLLEETIKTVTPKSLPYLQKVSNQSGFHPFNMFITHWEIFEEYAAWLFRILKSLEGKLVRTDSAYHNRSIGFLAERLLDVFILERGLKFKELPVVSIDKPGRFDQYLSKIKLYKH